MNDGSMQNPMADIIPYVVSRLAHSANRDDIIHWVCNQRNITWKDGELLVNTIEAENLDEISKRKRPVLFILSALAVVAGLVWSFYAFLAILLPIWWIYRDSGGVYEGVVWFANFWILFPQLLAGTGLAVGGFFGIRGALNKQANEYDDLETYER